jgi:phospholipid N-methyltransferase
VAEAKLIGMKLPGFFPTPRPVISRMLELAEIKDGDRVLEPSAGKGDILDMIREQHPDASVTAIEQNQTQSAPLYRVVVWRTYQDRKAKKERATTVLHRDELDPVLRLVAQCGERLDRGE